MRIAVKWENEGNVLVARLLGRIDSSNAEHFQDLVEAGLDSDESVLVLDFERVSYITSAGLHACVVIARRIRKLALCSLSGFNREIVAVSGFDKLFEVFESPAQAVRALGDE